MAGAAADAAAPTATGARPRKEEPMKSLDVIAGVLVVVGALNWGLVSVARFDLVAALFGLSFGQVSGLTAVVYGLVGVAGLYQALSWRRVQSRWMPQAARHA
jgi:uncharacterized membrane protein YuzA (DUF378 family)